MSSLTLFVYAKAAEESDLKRIKKFVSLLQEQEFDAIEAMDEEAVLYDIEEVVLLKSETLPEQLAYFKLDAPSSFEVEGLSSFLQNLGAEDVEIAAFSSQVGEYFFQQNDEVFDKRHETQWKYLGETEHAFFDEYVVVTGTFADHDREAIEAIVTANSGRVQQSVNAKTTLLVVGTKPGRSKLDKAAELGIATLEADDFWERLEEAKERQESFSTLNPPQES